MPDIFKSSKISETKAGLSTPKPNLKVGGTLTSGPGRSKDVVHKNGANEHVKEESLSEKDKKILNERGKSSLSSFCYYPERVNFVNKDPEEEIILLLRKHPITTVKWLSAVFLFVVAPAFLSTLPFFELLPFRFNLVIILIWYLITFSVFFEQFLKWFFHVNIITDERIIEVDFYNLVYRELTDANIDQIQDVTVQVGGGFQTSLNYGNLVIQTAAEIPQITFEKVPEPDLVAKILRDLRVEEEIEKLEGRVR